MKSQYLLWANAGRMTEMRQLKEVRIALLEDNEGRKRLRVNVIAGAFTKGWLRPVRGAVGE